ncbi:Brefeldin A-sensitivity 4 [Hyphodiscus hymeniophilus]|uniref:Brefeldin A-sensitivity 4 n=1 Tax=Hyphodiscus hymeniophilus TaxID=353542 RepID=A0A9P7AYC4_9HELO|nr:Brefeldin A-sensitivity 4 [Hyphodiscus hymeniophilus]
MASSQPNDNDETPKVLLTSPSVERRPQPSASQDPPRRRFQLQNHSEGTSKRHVRLETPSGVRSSASSIYLGSYGHRRDRSGVSIAGSTKSPGNSVPGTPRASMSHSHLEDLLLDLNLDLETYGVEELRDGFFDASFFKPPRTDHEHLMRDAEYTLPAAFQNKHPLSPSNFLPKQWQGIKTVCRSVTTTRAGIKLTKSFLGFFVAYILCLVPSVREWLGRYSYVMVISAIINHPGRTVGAQLDGAFLTILGTATGLGWGAFALWLSDSTGPARRGYGGILAAFLVIFMGTIAALRSYFIRMYQLVICAGIAVTFTCLADTSTNLDWQKLFSYGIPWLFGQALCLTICIIVVPDAGARPLAVSLHDAFGVMHQGLVLPHPDDIMLHRQLAWTFVGLSQAYRDLTLDISITRFRPSDVMMLRNLMQSVIRSLLSLKKDTQLFDEFGDRRNRPGTPEPEITRKPTRFSKIMSPTTSNPTHILQASLDISQSGDDAVITIDGPKHPGIRRTDTEVEAIQLVADKLAEPTTELLSCMRSALARCDAVLMDMSGHRMFLGPPKSVSSDILGALTRIRRSMIKYDEEEDNLLEDPRLPPTYSNHPEVVELFLFVHPVRQAASSVEALLVKVNEMQQKHRGWRIYLPSYPWAKSLQRTNAQVRHDRGGVTAGFYFRSQSQLARTMKGMANIYQPLPARQNSKELDSRQDEVIRTDSMGKYEEEEDVAMSRTSHASKKKKFRYKLWVILHRLQGFETRFALKVIITTSLLSVPAWLSQSRGWWNEYESWWAVVTVWIMSHPRVGGNFQDLVTRALCGVLGAVWGGLAYGADNGNPYVMAVFAAVFMIPMMYRYTQSSHPRSGIVGCISFVVVSLGAKAADGLPSVAQIAWTRGVAFVVGVVAAVIVNWILWPFIARHELRKALSATLIYSSIIYRGVVAKYVYYQDGEEPQEKDIERSEMLEGRLREGFVRIRQLLALTRHEVRLRGPFNPLPYSALIDGCEHFFEYLVAVRQSSLFFHPRFMSDNEQAAESLLAYRRDAVAAILMNLYVLAGALRGDRKLPRYLPSAAAARKRLLDHMGELEASQAASSHVPGKERDSQDQNQTATRPEFVNLERSSVASSKEKEGPRWAQIYSYSYSQNLTGCVKQLEVLQKYTKEIVGEQGFDHIDASVYEDLSYERT